MTSRIALVLALMGLSSTASAATGGTMYYLEWDGDPRSDKRYYINSIDVHADGTATFGTRTPLSGSFSGGYAPQSMTMMADGSLVGTYGANGYTQVFVIDAADLASVGTASSIPVTMGGSINTTIEGAFTGCDDQLYLGDSGSDNVGAGGSVIRIDQSTLFSSSLSYETVIGTNATDIDGLGPGIVSNQVVDSPGYALDSGNLLTWDYLDGTVTNLGRPGVNYELHALGGDRFDDGQARLLGLNSHPYVALAIELKEIDPVAVSSSTIQSGPTVRASGLAGPMDCSVSTITGETATGGSGGSGSSDTDGDGVDDADDLCPSIDATGTDADGDGCIDDTDGDGVDDSADACPSEDATGYDDDGDGCIDDTDGDGVLDDVDNCPIDGNADQADADFDGIGDACEVDTDGDGWVDDEDNCVDAANASQADLDEDGEGDACDADADGDGDPATSDCGDLDPSRYATATEVCDDAIDNDCDGLVDLDDDSVDLDDPASDCDGDGYAYAEDNCADDFNPGQSDLDADLEGDVCDLDDDGDLVDDDLDNCPETANADQADSDGDGAGDACDDDVDGDGVLNADDLCDGTLADAPARGLGNSRWADVDGDGVFDTRGRNASGRAFTMDDTLGCSCEQIVAECGYGTGHERFGCSHSVMDTWTGLYDEAGGAVGSCKDE